MANENKNGGVKCSFCGRISKSAVKSAITNSIVCLDCVENSHDLLLQSMVNEPGRETRLNKAQQDAFETPDDVYVFTPSEIKRHLDQHVIGQEDAKHTLAVAVHNHYKRITQVVEDDGIEIQKSNILMIGPSGVGKTELAKTIAKFLDVPFCIADATTLTQAGYVGDDVENVLTRLIDSAKGDIKKAEKGIIFIDEIDKISRKGEGVSISRDVQGEGVQHALLKIVEGTMSRVPIDGGRKHPNGSNPMIDTSNILFICGGAFEGLQKVVEGRMKKDKSIGFGAMTFAKEISSDNCEWHDELETDDLIRYGLVPELVGRLPVLTMLKPLSKDDLVRIMLEPKNAITKQYKKLFAYDGIDLWFDDDAIYEIAEQAIVRKIGARGLRSILEKAMKQIMFELPDMQDVCGMTITRDVILGTGEPNILMKVVA